MATFVGYSAAGFPGAAVATIGVFVMPWLLAAAAARQLRPYVQHPRLRGFGRGAAPAVVGLLAVTIVSRGRSGLTGWAYVAVALGAGALTALTKLPPIAVLVAGAVVGVVIGRN